MNISVKQAERLLREHYTFKQLGFSMLLTRLKLLYANDNSSQSFDNYIKEINDFLEKYKNVMVDDIALIQSL